ncbi:MAG TPA: phage baseplate protein [Nitrosomonas nitrosa]|nr:phage baseplate protein [Nitrosomonas nitrosa]HNP50647.1 hypothetical protein [Nitrosomonas nitrosa]
MRTLTANDMINVWEQGLNQPLLQKALILLVATYPEMPPDALAEMSIGQRDRHLLQLRARLFGHRLLNSAVCPACGERLEWENRVADFLVSADESNAAASEFHIEVDDYALHFRLLNSLDIAAVINTNDADKAQKLLLSRCLLKAEHSGASCTIEQLPDVVLQKLSEQIEALDPQAEIRINLNCPACSHHWDVLFDITSFLWEEINDWAERMLQTIHKLALGYGWSERDILNLSPVRRQLYLGMLRP